LPTDGGDFPFCSEAFSGEFLGFGDASGIGEDVERVFAHVSHDGEFGAWLERVGDECCGDDWPLAVTSRLRSGLG
jgi:hypothetical protein